MSKFEFSDAAKLWAANAELAEGVRDAYSESVNAFRSALKRAVNEEVSPLSVVEKCPSSYAYWWLGESKKSSEPQIKLWWACYEPRIVDPGMLRVHLGGEAPSAAAITRLRELVESRSLSDREVPGGKNEVRRWDIFVTEIRYDQTDPVGTAIRPLVELLQVAHAACQIDGK